MKQGVLGLLLFGRWRVDESDRKIYEKLMDHGRYEKTENFLRLLHEAGVSALEEITEYRGLLTAAVKAENRIDENFQMIFGAYMTTTKDVFDDYMIALEWNRVPQAQFWLPRRRILEKNFHIATKIQNLLDSGNGKLSVACTPALMSGCMNPDRTTYTLTQKRRTTKGDTL